MINERKSNVVLGIIGALVGAALGGVLWIAIYHFGYIASIAGIAIVMAAFKGYELLGGTLDVKGVIISVIISIITIFVANWLSWSYDICTVLNEEWEMDVPFSEICINLFKVLEYFEITGEFVKDLLVGYGLSLLGVGSTVVNAFNAAKTQNAPVSAATSETTVDEDATNNDNGFEI